MACSMVEKMDLWLADVMVFELEYLLVDQMALVQVDSKEKKMVVVTDKKKVVLLVFLKVVMTVSQLAAKMGMQRAEMLVE
jgi:hypothetical protein